jgi:nucleotide-binding universal stress UspA family protein
MKILLPVDGTELSLHETRFALQLVRAGLKASFVLANVQEPASFYEIVTAQDPGLIEDAAQEAAEDLMAPSAQLLREAGVPFETAALSGDPVNAMLELIEISGCDMVLMGARALGPIRRLIEGASVSRQLIDASPVPVLLVKPPVDADAP